MIFHVFGNYYDNAFAARLVTADALYSCVMLMFPWSYHWKFCYPSIYSMETKRIRGELCCLFIRTVFIGM